MTELGTLSVKLTATTAEFARKMKGVQEKMRGVAETAKRVSKIAAVAFAGMAASLAVVARAYDKQIRAERGLEAAFKAQGKAIDITRLKELASALQRVTLFGDEVTLGNMKMLASFGVTEGGIARLIPGMQDLASAMEVDLKTATMAVGKAMAGQAGSLSRYGISLSKAQLEAMKLGNEQQRLSILTGALASFQGQAAIAASTAAGRFTQLSNNFGDVLENIGEIVDAPLAAVLNTISTAVVAVGSFIKDLSPTFKTWAGRIAITVTILTGLVAGVAALIAIGPALIGIIGAITAAMGAALAAMLPVIIVLAIIAAAIASVILTVGIFKKAWDKNLFGMRDTIVGFVNDVRAGWKAIADGFSKAWDVVKDVAKSVLEKLGGWIETFVNKHIGILRRVGEALGIEKLAGLKDITIDLVFEDAEGKLAKIGEFIADKMKKGADFVVESWAEGLGIAKELLAPLIEKLKELVDIKLPEMPTGPAGLPPGLPPPTDGPAQDVAGNMQEVSNAAGNVATVFGQLGEGGGAIADVIRGIAAGGFWGAIISFFMRVIKRLAILQPLIDAFMDVIVMLAIALRPVLEAIVPISISFVRLGGLLFVLAIKIFPVFMALIALKGVFEWVALKVVKIGEIFVRNWNWAVGVLASIFGAIPIIGKNLRKYIEGFEIILQDMEPPVNDFGNAASEGGSNMRRGAEEAAEGFRELSESMGNVPSGFKVAFARFEASDPLNMMLGGGPMALAGAGGFNIENMNVYTDDVDDLAEQIQDESEWQGYADTGSPAADEEERYSGGTRHRQ